MADKLTWSIRERKFTSNCFAELPKASTRTTTSKLAAVFCNEELVSRKSMLEKVERMIFAVTSANVLIISLLGDVWKTKELSWRTYLVRDHSRELCSDGRNASPLLIPVR